VRTFTTTAISFTPNRLIELDQRLRVIREALTRRSSAVELAPEFLMESDTRLRMDREVLTLE
jgi:hypothetical protein